MQYKYIAGIVLSEGIKSLMIFVFILGLMNLIVWGILRIITLPVRFLTIWGIGFAISIFVVILTDEFVTGVTINGWTPVIIIALAMWIISSLLS